MSYFCFMWTILARDLNYSVKNIQDDLARASQELEDTKRNMDTLDSQRKMAMKDKVTAEGKVRKAVI